ncbi:cryptochrome/photolyase family protein [Aestuariivirga sp.]|uniref:cryptochrome/photolyase family protein n=1 Tax=Aestuariivirga sp. TaxID=2650926 RepID=UPI0039E3BF64
MSAPVIMWFRQDLRLSDHPALAAAAAAGPVIPLFVLDDETAGDWRWGGASRWWLHRSLESLGASVPLVLRRGRADTVLAEVLKATGAKALYFTRDYAPWSPALEQRVKAVCEQAGAECHRYGGFLLHEPEAIRNGSGAFFKVYTPFSKACFAKGEPRAAKGPVKPTWATHTLERPALESLALLPTRPNWATGFEPVWRPGEAGAQARLVRFLDDGLHRYADGRDRPDQENTSQLSPHLHWGEISPHQVWQATRQAMDSAAGRLDRDGEKFLKEVLWREFSYHLVHHVPSFPETPFRPEFADFPWAMNDGALKRWQQGQTGYPIVDAGMRELWTTGIMHNRVRMIAASFLIKHLLLPWQEGERWFWDTLVDADIGNNAASWQWVAGCGADAAPYFRIFNPMLQGEKFDPNGEYVKRWVPELKDVPAASIHKPWEMTLPPKAYPSPMIDHNKARERALAAFAAIKKDEA